MVKGWDFIIVLGKHRFAGLNVNAATVFVRGGYNDWILLYDKTQPAKTAVTFGGLLDCALRNHCQNVRRTKLGF